MGSVRMKELLVIIFLIFLAVLPVGDLTHPGLFIAHDSRDHVERIANFVAAIHEGTWIPRWGANLNWGYGHPVLQFLYPLPSYIAFGFNSLGWSLVDSTKLLFAVTYVLSILAMYLLGRVIFGRWGGLAAAIVYGFSPYRFVDMYVRGAIGEHTAFVFAPLVFLFIWLLGQEKMRLRWIWRVIGLGLSTAGLILSHNAVSLMIFGAGAIFAGVISFSQKEKKRYWYSVCLGVVAGLGLAAFFWIPAFWEGKYTLRDIVTRGEIVERFVPWNDFFKSGWNYGGGSEFSKEIGWLIWLALITSSLLLIRDRKRINTHVWMASTGIFVISIFMMTGLSKIIWESVSILAKFQFPWRFLTLSVFSGAILVGQTVAWLGKWQKIAVVVVLVLAISGTQEMWRANEYKEFDERYFTGLYPGTTDTGESSPIWSVRFMEKFPIAPLEVIEGEAEIKFLSRSGSKHVYNIDARSPVRLVENTLYFPGWTVFVDGEIVETEFQDANYRGLMTFGLREGSHNVEILFQDTKLRKTANYISLFTFIGGLVIVSGYIWQKKLKYQ